MYQLLEIRKGLKSYLIADTFSKIKNLLFRRFFCLEIFYFPQLPINKSLSFLRGFYWYLTIIEGRVFLSLYLAVRYYSGKLLSDLFLTVTNKCWYVQVIPKGNYWSFCCCFFLRIIFFEQRRIIV